MIYQVKHHRLFEKEILKLSSLNQQKVYQTIDRLRRQPDQLPVNTLPLTGHRHVYRTRIGQYRLIYFINHQKKMIILLGVSSRGNVYKLIQKLLNEYE